MKFTTPYPNAQKTEDHYFCRDCCHCGPANEINDIPTCELCDSPDVITWRQHERAMDEQYERELIAADEAAAQRLRDVHEEAMRVPQMRVRQAP